MILISGISLSSVAAEEQSIARSRANAIVKKDDGSHIDVPYHPINPEELIEIDEDEYPKTEGPLSINYVSAITFGSQEATGEDTIFKSELSRVIYQGKSLKVPNYVQVSDHRGSNSGWRLEVKQSDPFKNGVYELNGTELKLSNTKLNSLSGDMTVAPKVVGDLSLSSNDEYQLLIQADKDQGMGTWLIRFGEDNNEAPESVTLFVPGKSKKVKGHYQTTLFWQLKDTPTE